MIRQETSGITGGTWDYQQAANYLGCTKGTLEHWVSKRKVPYIKVGYLTRFLKEDLDGYLAQRRVLPVMDE